MQKENEHAYRIWSIVGTAMVWIALWFLLDIALKQFGVKGQILAHFIVLVVGVIILNHISQKGLLTT